MTMEQQIVIGKIVAPHGVRGEFRIMPLTDQPQRYAKMKIVHLMMDGISRLFPFGSIKMSIS